MRDHRGLPQAPLSLGVLFGKDVTLVGVPPLELTLAGKLETPTSHAFGLFLRHRCFPGLTPGLLLPACARVGPWAYARARSDCWICFPASTAPGRAQGRCHLGPTTIVMLRPSS